MTAESSLEPIARGLVAQEICTLSPEQLDERVAMIRSEIAPGVIGRAEQPDGVAWEFESSAEMRAKLEGLAARERQCCGSDLAFEVSDDREAGRLRFEIRGVHAGAFRMLESDAPTASSAPRSRETSTWQRLARAGSAGLGVSLFVCCVLPIGLVALVGASVARPLLQLDQPWVIGSSALAFGAAAWLYERRRAARAANAAAARTPSSACGC